MKNIFKIPFRLALSKHLKINLTKMHKAYTLKTTNTMEIKESLNKERNMLHPWTGKLNILMLSFPPKLIYRFNAILIKILSGICINGQANPNTVKNAKVLK